MILRTSRPGPSRDTERIPATNGERARPLRAGLSDSSFAVDDPLATRTVVVVAAAVEAVDLAPPPSDNLVAGSVACAGCRLRLSHPKSPQPHLEFGLRTLPTNTALVPLSNGLGTLSAASGFGVRK